jgi:hypothetical protein
MDPCKLESLLDKTIKDCNLRDILAKYGIPINESVRFDIESNHEVIASCHLPLKNYEVSSQDPISSLTKLRNELVNFLNAGQDLCGLVEEIASYKPQSSLFKIHLNIGTAQFNIEQFYSSTMSFTMGYMIPCPPRPACAK